MEQTDRVPDRPRRHDRLPGLRRLTQDPGGCHRPEQDRVQQPRPHLPGRNITLSGDAALWYVRGKSLPGWRARTRAENQRNVLKAILAKGLSAEIVTDPFTFTHFFGNAAKRIKVDKSLTNAELRSTATSLRMKPDDITLITVPLGKERTVGVRRSIPSIGVSSPNSAERCARTPWRRTSRSTRPADPLSCGSSGEADGRAEQ